MTTCTRCGERSRLGFVFQHHKRLLRADHCLCPPCAAARRGWAVRLGNTLVGTVWTALLILMASFLDTHRLLFVLLGLYGVPLVMTVAHECIHALAGWWMGARVFELRIGAGPPRWSGFVGSVRITLRSHLLGGGLCVAAFPDLQTRAQAAVFTGAPIVFHALIAVLLLPQLAPLSELTMAGAAVDAVFGFNALLVMVNLWPHEVSIGAGMYPSDGRQLLSILRSTSYVEDYRDYAPGYLCSYAAFNGAREEAARYATALRRAYPSPVVTPDMIAIAGYLTAQYDETEAFLRDLPPDPSPQDGAERQQEALGVVRVSRLPALMRSLLLCKAGRIDESIALLEEAIAALPDGIHRVVLQSNLAYFLARYRPTEADLDRSAELIRDSLLALPWVSYIRGNAGVICILLGHDEAGLAHLQRANATGEDPHNVSIRSAYSALAYARQGKWPRSARALQRARIMSGDDELIAQIEQHIAAEARGAR